MFETKNAIANGSSEIDMVINIGFLKDGRYEEVEEEIKRARSLQMQEQNLSKYPQDSQQQEQHLMTLH